MASGPVSAEIFFHVVDASGHLVAQADGPALGGMVPLWLWQAGDRVYDVRHILLPHDEGPYTVSVGVYDSKGRYPALMHGTRRPGDAAPLATIVQ
jgi:hypothetical protein